MSSPSSGMLSWRGKHLDYTVRAASLDSFIPGCVGVVVDLVGDFRREWQAASFSANWAILGYESESGQISPIDTNRSYLEFGLHCEEHDYFAKGWDCDEVFTVNDENLLS